MVMKVGVEGWDLIGSSGPGNCVSHFVPFLSVGQENHWQDTVTIHEFSHDVLS
jgi:hypothetical protein